jgi:hypothetical protein
MNSFGEPMLLPRLLAALRSHPKDATSAPVAGGGIGETVVIAVGAPQTVSTLLLMSLDQGVSPPHACSPP